MVSGEPALYDTRVACQWDEERLYVAYWIEEPQVKATLTERDSFIWNDNDVELFVAGDDCYYELEINAFGTVYEAFFVWQDALRRGSRFDRAGLDPIAGTSTCWAASRTRAATASTRAAAASLPRLRPRRARDRRARGRDDQRPRRPSTAAGRSRWRCRGRAWPSCSTVARCLRSEGETLRCDFSRFEALRVHGKPLPENPGWSLNPHGVYDSHIPESFSVVHFTEKPPAR